MSTVTLVDTLIPANSDEPTPPCFKPAPLPNPVALGRGLRERSMLFLETLCERVNNMMAHDRAGMPPLLGALLFCRLTNYGLLRTTEVNGN